MLSTLDGLRAVLGSNRVMVLAELGAGYGDRAAPVPTLQQSGAARVLGHDSNSC